MDPQALYHSVEKKEAWIRSHLHELVAQESPSDDRSAVNAATDLLERWALELDGAIKRHKQKDFGDVLELRFGRSRQRKKPVLLLGHLDTVWPVGTLQTMAWREAKGRYWGPGVLDMKAGVVMALAAIKSLHEFGLSQPVTLLLNSEEEVGSPVSRAITEKIALTSAAVFVLEPAQGLAYKTARKGVGQYNVKVTGV